MVVGEFSFLFDLDTTQDERLGWVEGVAGGFQDAGALVHTLGKSFNPAAIPMTPADNDKTGQ